MSTPRDTAAEADHLQPLLEEFRPYTVPRLQDFLASFEDLVRKQRAVSSEDLEDWSPEERADHEASIAAHERKIVALKQILKGHVSTTCGRGTAARM
jgi:hypothetical protein